MANILSQEFNSQGELLALYATSHVEAIVLLGTRCMREDNSLYYRLQYTDNRSSLHSCMAQVTLRCYSEENCT